MQTPHEEYYHVEFEIEDMRDIKPFNLQNFLKEKCQQQLEEVEMDSRNRFSSKVKRAGIKNQLQNINNFEDLPIKSLSQFSQSNKRDNLHPELRVQ